MFTHDLRNPLSALHSNVGYLSSAANAALDEDAREALEDMVVACEGLGHIIDNLDLFAVSLTESQVAGQLASAGVNTLVQAVVERCRLAATSHGVELQVRVAPAVAGATVRVAADAYERSLGNLVRNAIQHAPFGSVIEISAEKNDDQVGVLVLDRGTRVHPEQAKEVFSASGQAKLKGPSISRYSRGLGLHAAAIAASAAGARVSVGDGGELNRFELWAAVVPSGL